MRLRRTASLAYLECMCELPGGDRRMAPRTGAIEIGETTGRSALSGEYESNPRNRAPDGTGTTAAWWKPWIASVPQRSDDHPLSDLAHRETDGAVRGRRTPGWCTTRLAGCRFQRHDAGQVPASPKCGKPVAECPGEPQADTTKPRIRREGIRSADNVSVDNCLDRRPGFRALPVFPAGWHEPLREHLRAWPPFAPRPSLRSKLRAILAQHHMRRQRPASSAMEGSGLPWFISG